MFRRNVPARPTLSADVREQLAKSLPGDEQHRTLYDVAKCSHCGGLHDHACPRVRKMRFRPVPGGGTALVEVEFWPEGQWSRDGIIWPWDVYVDGREYATPEDGAERLPVGELTSSTP